MSTEPALIHCRDSCGASVPAADIEQSGWEFLAISRTWRCSTCRRVLDAINRPVLETPPCTDPSPTSS